MPLEGWQNTRFGTVAKKVIADRGKPQPANIQSVIDRIAGKQAESGQASPSGLKVDLPSQHIPKGYEALTHVPSWADNSGTGARQRVITSELQHAIGIPGTNHVFISDVKLTNQQLEASLADFKKATELTGHLFPGGVAVHVPSTKNGKYGRERGWVYQHPDKRVFYMRPAVMKDVGAYSNEETHRRHLADKKRRDEQAISAASWKRPQWAQLKNFDAPAVETYRGWSMPAASSEGGKNHRLYTMVHEIGHVYDAKMNHLGDFFGRGGTVDGYGLFKAKRSELSAYGRTKEKEGYAEAFAQFYVGGKGSNSAADAYARVFDWKATP